MNWDQASEFARRAINVLFVANPKGTSIGILIGVILDGLIGFFSPLLKTIEWVSFSAVKIWHLMGLGVVVMNFPAYLYRKDVDPSIIKAFKLIDAQKANKSISGPQAKQLHVNLLNTVIQSIALNAEKEAQMDRLTAMARRPGTGEDELEE
ncbi:hypothetical protein [Pseudomonas sp. K5002]|uniref:hypothetical protein n=1 Tax=Pseudomonas sp. K5002 TaxID=2738828 RepID=UPI0015BEFA68|nr:hypothetical protein [Pseudomonas sp. K5002]NWD88230.1 hypothetical protein [Pseudomonas sp. K5002]